MTGNTEGSGPQLAPEGNETLQRRVPAQAPLTSHRSPDLGTRTPVSLLPHPSSEPSLRISALTPPGAQSPPTSNPAGQSPHPARSPTSLLRVWRTERSSGSTLASPATHRPQARAHPAAAFSNLSARVSLMMRRCSPADQLAAAARTGEGETRAVRVGKGGKDRGSGPLLPWGGLVGQEVREEGERDRGGRRGKPARWPAHALTVETPTHPTDLNPWSLNPPAEPPPPPLPPHRQAVPRPAPALAGHFPLSHFRCRPTGGSAAPFASDPRQPRTQSRAGQGRGGDVRGSCGSCCAAHVRAPVVSAPSWLVIPTVSGLPIVPRGPPGGPVPYSPKVYFHSSGSCNFRGPARSSHLSSPSELLALSLSVTFLCHTNGCPEAPSLIHFTKCSGLLLCAGDTVKHMRSRPRGDYSLVAKRTDSQFI